MGNNELKTLKELCLEVVSLVRMLKKESDRLNDRINILQENAKKLEKRISILEQNKEE